jgi:hypothetical protein
MNKFDTTFFQKYVPDWQELKDVIHTHPVTIILSLVVKLGLFVWIPVFLYFYSMSIQSIIPFFVLEIYLILAYIKLIYDIFNWYNDVWIITDTWVVNFERSFLKANSNTINYENIEWVGVEQNWVLDKILSKWDIVIHQVWEDTFTLKNVVSPYKAVDTIESFRSGSATENEKFDMIMDALSWVVWDYLQQWKEIKKKVEKEEKEIDEELDKIKWENWTIDLR